MRQYCTQNNGRCWNCPLAKAGQDCRKRLAMWWDVYQAAGNWSLTPKRVEKLLRDGLVPEAELVEVDGVSCWRIPIDTPNPLLQWQRVLQVV